MRSGHSRRSAEALAAYERRLGPSLLAVRLACGALAFVLVLPRLPIPSWLILLSLSLWVILLLDYVWRIGFLAPDPQRYWRRWPCTLDLMILTTFPLALVTVGSAFFGFLCLIRAVPQAVRLAREHALAGRSASEVGHWASRYALVWLLPVAGVAIVLSAANVLRAESHHADSGIHSFREALWWAVATMLRVDYGDTYPHTIAGQIPAVVLILLGFALFGLGTAALAAIFVEEEEASPVGAAQRLLDDMERLAALHRGGQLTDEEFDALKAGLLSKQSARGS